MTLRRAAILAHVVFALALVAIWQALHTERLARETEFVAVCDRAMNRDERAIDRDFAGIGAVREALSGPAFLMTYSTQTSALRSLWCSVSVDGTGHATTTIVVRFLRQEAWLPGATIPVWGDMIWPALQRASVPLTP